MSIHFNIIFFTSPSPPLSNIKYFFGNNTWKVKAVLPFSPQMIWATINDHGGVGIEKCSFTEVGVIDYTHTVQLTIHTIASHDCSRESLEQPSLLFSPIWEDEYQVLSLGINGWQEARVLNIKNGIPFTRCYTGFVRNYTIKHFAYPKQVWCKCFESDFTIVKTRYNSWLHFWELTVPLQGREKIFTVKNDSSNFNVSDQ